MERKASGVEVTSPCHRLASRDDEICVLAPSYVQASFPASNRPRNPHSLPFLSPFSSWSQSHGPQEQRKTHIFRALRASACSRSFAYALPARLLHRRDYQFYYAEEEMEELEIQLIKLVIRAQSWGDFAPKARSDLFRKNTVAICELDLKRERAVSAKPVCVVKEGRCFLEKLKTLWCLLPTNMH